MLVGYLAVPQVYTARQLPSRFRERYLLSLGRVKDWDKLYRHWRWPSPDDSQWAKPKIVQEMRAGKWAGSWTVPSVVVAAKVVQPGDQATTLRPDQGTKETESASHEVQPGSSSALLMLHIFSTSSGASRARRQAIREHHPIRSIHPRYRHLVEIKFVLGRHESHGLGSLQIYEVELENMKLEEEQAIHGDLVRLEGLRNGKNMDDGKTLEWARWVGRKGARQAQWVL